MGRAINISQRRLISYRRHLMPEPGRGGRPIPGIWLGPPAVLSATVESSPGDSRAARKKRAGRVTERDDRRSCLRPIMTDPPRRASLLPPIIHDLGVSSG